MFGFDYLVIAGTSILLSSFEGYYPSAISAVILETP